MERKDKRKHPVSLPLQGLKGCQRDAEGSYPLEVCKKRLCSHGVLQSGVVSLSAQDVKPRSAAVVSSPSLTCQQSSLDVAASHHFKQDASARASMASAVSLPGHSLTDTHQSSATSDTSSSICSSTVLSDVTSNSCSSNAGRRGCHGLLDLPPLQDKLTRLETSEPEFHEVMNRFMAGFSLLANETKVTCVSKVCYGSSFSQVRQQAFKQQEKVTKTLRGDANVRYAWYGTTKQEVSGVILHGFGQPKNPKDGAKFGAGIYLSPEKYSNLSAVFSDVDENGDRHLILCRVIMGQMEQICRGSVQFHPSSEDYDGGVNDLGNPKLYIVWPTHMNTHILPEYVVSFKLTATWQGIMTELKNRQRVRSRPTQFECGHTQHVKVKGDLSAEEEPTSRISHSAARSPWMSIELFLLLLKWNLSATSMETLQRYYCDFKNGRLSSSDFISNVRLIAGDHLVSTSIRSMRANYMGAAMLQSMLVSGRYPMTGNNRIA